ncbi:YiiX/YebB-like N1pC/P60 family cysteine hydrolase [Tautonia plasticadhaerens]|uniref:Permuted papain-like amidase YaeF/Yiix C92 family enzyme n=1 Tax=Tautonia plasticadhaerens TaxID=2527974 RepID=A0A518GX20_9BACT|nr:YiiX/YebB-like N1pC/P60 family cysteine hydrolase [Tautonia plasticadhaerens]QDV33113.1 hypothetical protein ElP_09550 [Tautonia plasticadhaerens]
MRRRPRHRPPAIAIAAIATALSVAAGPGCRAPERPPHRPTAPGPWLPGQVDRTAWSAGPWGRWAATTLADGDLVFRHGRDSWGPQCISELAAAVADSPFSHVGLYASEGGEPVVYDARMGGVRRVPFDAWMAEVRGAFGVRRVRPEDRGRIPAALAFCRSAFESGARYDFVMRIGGDRFYCGEFVERAYRSAGLALSEPIRLADLPRLDEFPAAAFVVRCLAGIEPDRPIVAVGSPSFGLWASPATVPVFATPDGTVPPLGA